MVKPKNIESFIDGYTDVTVVCPFCGRPTTVSVPTEQARDYYENGARAQDAFPDLDDTSRETLISGLCDSCQNDVFGNVLDNGEE